MSDDQKQSLAQLMAARFSDAPQGDVENAVLRSMAARGSVRRFTQAQVPEGWLDVICAAAMAAPSKSDLQQRDIIVVKSAAKRAALAKLVAGQAWVADAPLLVVFCGNNRRQRLLHDWQDVPFANDHLDAFFNAVGDAAIALGAFVTAAEALGLGCCPISAVRNEAQAVSELLALPDHVFPFAGLAVGFPQETAPITRRLPLGVTCHVDSYAEEGLQEAVTEYDGSRSYAKQRETQTFGTAQTYGWSHDKVRQYSVPERADFGAYVRARGFKLD